MKRVLITGGNKGIGLETTKLFLENDYEVIVVARDFKDFPYKNNQNVKEVVFDVSKVSEIEALVYEVGAVDVLVNNAGVMNSLPYTDYPEEKKEFLMKVNLYAPIEFITHMSDLMMKQGHGRIITTASVAGHIGHPDIWYGVSKAGIINVTKSFAKMLAPKGILVNAVAPGPVETDMLHIIPKDRKEFMKANVYLDRFATPDEVAKAIYWLGTDSPEYMNGVCLDVNNGAFPR